MAAKERVDLTMSSSQIEYLIELYKEHSLLWNPDHESYTYRPARALALREIAEKMGSGWTEDLVKKKWNVLKSAYNRELKRLIELTKTGIGDVYAPQWWLFQNLDMFLRPHALSRKRAVESHSIEDGSPGPSFERVDDSHDGSMECEEIRERFMRTDESRNGCVKSEAIRTICIDPDDTQTVSSESEETPTMYIQPEIIRNVYMEPENIRNLFMESRDARNKSIKLEAQNNGCQEYELVRSSGIDSSEDDNFILTEEISSSKEETVKTKAAIDQCVHMMDSLRNRVDNRPQRQNERQDADELYCAMMATELRKIVNEDMKDEAKFEMMRILKDFKKKDRQLKLNQSQDHI